MIGWFSVIGSLPFLFLFFVPFIFTFILRSSKFIKFFTIYLSLLISSYTLHFVSQQFLASQETHYISTTEPNRLRLFKETVAVYCENHTEHTDTVRTSQETHYVSATEPLI
jgi:NhaP-type Na+/H+ or K+/H+ antiporter